MGSHFRTTAKYDLVICDIDGCLSPESHAVLDIDRLLRLADHNRRAVRLKDRPLVTLCSGRPIGFVECLCRLLQNTEVPAIGENGVWLWSPVDNVFECDPTISEEQLEMVHEARKFLRHRFQSDGVVQQPGKTASIALYHPNPEFLKSIIPVIDQEFQDRQWPIRVSMTWFYINCDLEHITKATAIDRLLSHTGIDASRTVGIGDTISDRFIADRVAWFGCPSNADEDIQKMADYVSEHAEVDGVLDLIRQLA